MPAFCDVALPVPLDRTFTYAVHGQVPEVGARVIVPFSGQRLMGVVMRLHDDALPDGIEVKPVQTVMDVGPLLGPEQMELARWVAQYYCAPLGEVVRGMLPLAAEVRRQFVYGISEAGRRVLYDGAAKGASRRSRLTPEEQNREYAVLNYLEGGETAKAGALRSATGANRSLLEGMVKKKWLLREALAEERDARRLVKVAVVVEALPGNGTLPESGTRLPKLNENQLAVMAELASVGGRLEVAHLRDRLRRRGVPESSVATLVKRGLLAMEEEAEEFALGGVGVAGKKHAHEHALNEEQMEVAGTLAAAMAREVFGRICCMG